VICGVEDDLGDDLCHEHRRRECAAIAAIATSGAPSNTMLKAKAQPGVTCPPSPKRNHRAVSPKKSSPQKIAM
jgi:hypothetical protein